MRKGFDGLSAMETGGLGRDPLAGDCSLIANRPRTRAMVLMWDGTGLCIFMKNLERGRFADLRAGGEKVVRMTASELALFIEGCTLVGKKSLSPAALVRDDLAVVDRL